MIHWLAAGASLKSGFSEVGVQFEKSFSQWAVRPGSRKNVPNPAYKGKIYVIKGTVSRNE